MEITLTSIQTSIVERSLMNQLFDNNGEYIINHKNNKEIESIFKSIARKKQENCDEFCGLIEITLTSIETSIVVHALVDILSDNKDDNKEIEKIFKKILKTKQ